jgi:hypothetical protein
MRNPNEPRTLLIISLTTENENTNKNKNIFILLLKYQLKEKIILTPKRENHLLQNGLYQFPNFP